MELSSIKKDLKNSSVASSTELSEETSKVKYLSNLKESAMTPKAGITKSPTVHNFEPMTSKKSGNNSPKAYRPTDRQIKYLGLIIEKDEEQLVQPDDLHYGQQAPFVDTIKR